MAQTDGFVKREDCETGHRKLATLILSVYLTTCGGAVGWAVAYTGSMRERVRAVETRLDTVLQFVQDDLKEIKQTLRELRDTRQSKQKSTGDAP